MMTLHIDLKPEELKGIIDAIAKRDISAQEGYEQIMLWQSKNKIKK